MEGSKPPNFRRLAIVGVLFLILSIALLFWARDIIREAVVLPVSYLIWMLGIIIDGTPQIFFWGVVLLITFRIATLSLSRKKKVVAPTPSGYIIEDEPAATGRVVYWATKVDLLRAGRGGYYSRSFHGAFGRTLIDLLAYRNRLTTRQVEQGLRDGTLEIPQDIRDYVLECMRPLEVGRGGFFVGLWDQLVTLVTNGVYRLQDAYQRANQKSGNQTEINPDAAQARSHDPRAVRDDPRIKRILKYMEDELEVSNDETGR